MTDGLFLREQDKQELLRLLARHLPDVTAWAYGSRVNGGAHEGSDLDIVLRSPDLSPIPLEELRAFAQALRDSNIPILVEARDWARLPESFQQEIMKNYVVLRETVSEWKFRLDEIAEIVDCEHKTAPTVDSSIYRSIRTTDITNGIIDYNNANCVDYETYLEWTKRAVPEAQDIILAREAPVGEVGWIREGERVCLGQRTVLIKVKSDKVSKRFLLYYLINPETKYELQVQSAGSVVSHLNMKNIRAFPVSLPLLHEQKAIASVLSSLDDKIDLLHRQNKTLEAMAEALFRQWFVEEAREDWEEGCLGDFAVNVTKSAKVSDIKSDDVYIGLEHIERRNISLVNTGLGGDVESNKYCFKKMDILFGKLRPYFHKVCFSPFDGICSTDILVVRPKKKHLFGYCLFAFFQDDVIEYANLGSGGTRMPRTNWKTLAQYHVAIPDENKLMEFNDIVCSYVGKIEQNQKQIRTLEKLRDTLLPKLMSGEVRVAYAHEHIE